MSHINPEQAMAESAASAEIETRNFLERWANERPEFAADLMKLTLVWMLTGSMATMLDLLECAIITPADVARFAQMRKMQPQNSCVPPS